MDNPATVASGNWSVTGQTPGIEQGAGGNFAKGVNVHFTTASGLFGTVFVPENVYSAPNSADEIRKLIAAKAARMEQIGKLSG